MRQGKKGAFCPPRPAGFPPRIFGQGEWGRGKVGCWAVREALSLVGKLGGAAFQEQIAGRRNGFCVRMAWEPSGVPTR